MEMLHKTKFYNSLIVSIVVFLLSLGCDPLKKEDSNIDLTEKQKIKIKSEGWTKFSDMSIDPSKEDINPWIEGGNFNLKELDNGVLFIQTMGNLTGHFAILDDRLNNESGTTIEIRMTVTEAPTDPNYHDAAIVAIQDGKREGKLAFLADRVIVYDQNTPVGEYELDTATFHTYRMIIFRDNIMLFVDRKLAVSASLHNTVKSKQIFWGDLHPKEGKNLAAAITYICYRTEGAF